MQTYVIHNVAFTNNAIYTIENIYLHTFPKNNICTKNSHT